MAEVSVVKGAIVVQCTFCVCLSGRNYLSVMKRWPDCIWVDGMAGSERRV